MNRSFRRELLIIGISACMSSLSWASPPPQTAPNVPVEVLSQSLFSLSIKELGQAASSYKFLRRVILSEYFYRASKQFWLENKKYQNLVDFPQFWVLSQIKANFHNLEWRKKAVHMLLDTESQFAEIPAGTFQMGSPATNHGRCDDEDLHWVHLSSPYRLQRVAFTQLLLVLITGKNTSTHSYKMHCPADHLELQVDEKTVSLCPRYPAETISWDSLVEDSQESSSTVLGILREQFGIHTRLPTEAEWERAARGLNDTYQSYSFGEITQDHSSLQAHSWYQLNSKGQPHRVASKIPNPLGLFDMHGNIWEWVADGYNSYSAAPDQNHPLVNPVSKFLNLWRPGVARGGSFSCTPPSVRSARRLVLHISRESSNVGFRLIRTQ